MLDTSFVRPRTHTVVAGETLIEIATKYGLEYRDIAKWNVLVNPNLIEVGQKLQLVAPEYEAQAQAVPSGGLTPLGQPRLERTSPAEVASLRAQNGAGAAAGVRRETVIVGEQSPATATGPAAASLIGGPLALKLPYSEQNRARLLGSSPSRPRQALVSPTSQNGLSQTNKAEGIVWSWPVEGKVETEFDNDNRGMDINGARGETIRASAAGKVIYVGSGIKGFGQIVIILHAGEFVSLYAHNDKIFVAESDQVKRGTAIAAMGSTGLTDQVRLHFQIRRGTKVFNPREFLPAKPN